MKIVVAIFVNSAMVFSLMVALAGVLAPTAQAEQASDTKPQTQAQARTKRTPALREVVFKRLSKAQDFADKEQYDNALAALKKMRARKLNSYESAMVWNLTGYIHYSREHYPAAIEAYSALINETAIPEALRQTTLFSLAKLYFVTEEYGQAIELLSGWEKQQANPGLDTYLLLAQAYYQTGKYEQVVNPMNQAIALAGAQGQPVKENWYLLLRGAYYQLQDYPSMKSVLVTLVELNPKREYLVQLAAVYGELNETKKQTAVLLAAYEKGLLGKESDIVNLAYLLLASDVPYKSGAILSREMQAGNVKKNEKNLKLLADSWVMAKETTLAATILKEAAELSNDGDLYVQLAQVHLDQKHWRQAAEYANISVHSKSIKNVETAYLVAGIAYFNLGQLENSKKAFSQAKTFAKSEKSASQWMAFIDKELARKAALELADSKT